MDRAHAILSKYEREHHRIAQALLERETLTAEEMRAIVAGKTLPPLVVSPTPEKESKGKENKGKDGKMKERDGGK